MVFCEKKVDLCGIISYNIHMLSNKARHIITWEGNMTTLDKLHQLAKLEKQMAKLERDIDSKGISKVLNIYGPKHNIWHAGAKIAHLKTELEMA